MVSTPFSAFDSEKSYLYSFEKKYVGKSTLKYPLKAGEHFFQTREIFFRNGREKKNVKCYFCAHNHLQIKTASAE